MNKKQKVILSLLQEIDEICQQNQIEYYLSPRLTLCAVEGKPFPQNPMFGIVLMKVADMERFRKAVDEDPRERRALESLKSHKWFSGLYLRYTNTDTLCLNMDNTRDYAFPGIGVSIFPLRSEAESASAGRRFSRDENAWMDVRDRLPVYTTDSSDCIRSRRQVNIPLREKNRPPFILPAFLRRVSVSRWRELSFRFRQKPKNI